LSAAFKLRSLRAFVYRCPIDTPVVTSFGTMRERPMVLVRAEDLDGTVGWGEAWCNFPAVGAEHRRYAQQHHHRHHEGVQAVVGHAHDPGEDDRQQRRQRRIGHVETEAASGGERQPAPRSVVRATKRR